jgi:hypothetical protein
MFAPTQANAADLALKLPGKAMHVRALCSGLISVRSSLLYVKNMLEDMNIQWHHVQDTVARELTMSSMFLGGILDGCVIAELPPNHAPNKAMSFFGTPFHDADLRAIQVQVTTLRSSDQDGQEVQANLLTVINFWKHYLPYQPLPTEFTRGRMQPLRDFQLVLSGDGEKLSGPVVHDLLIPAFNAACRITSSLLLLHAVAGDYNVLPIDM